MRSATSWRRRYFWILPLGVMGNSETISRRSGNFWRASCWPSRNAMISGSVRDCPSRGMTTAQARSPSRGSSMATMATPATFGCV